MPEPTHPRDGFSVYRKGRDGVKPVPRAFVLLPEVDEAALMTMLAFIEHPDVKNTKMGAELKAWAERIERGEKLHQVPSGRAATG